MLDETAYRRWWQLHLRVARGELLSSEDRAVYDTLLRDLDEDESFLPLQQASEARKELRELEAQRLGLQQRRTQLDEEIADLERKLAPQARHLISAEE